MGWGVCACVIFCQHVCHVPAPLLQVALGLAVVSLPSTFQLPVPSRTPGQEFDYKTVRHW